WGARAGQRFGLGVGAAIAGQLGNDAHRTVCLAAAVLPPPASVEDGLPGASVVQAADDTRRNDVAPRSESQPTSRSFVGKSRDDHDHNRERCANEPGERARKELALRGRQRFRLLLENRLVLLGGVRLLVRLRLFVRLVLLV